MEPNREFIIDPRTPADLRREIARLAASYTPEWNFDPDDPDVGAAIALIFANQMGENLKRLNQVLGKYHTEFVNMLNVSLLPAYPASGMAVVELIRDTVPGIDLPHGTKLVGQTGGADSEPIIFETVSDVYITNSRLTDILSISGTFGKIIPILGGPQRPELTPGRPAPAPEEAAPGPEFPPVSLFDYSAPGVERSALLIYHKSVFRTPAGVRVAVRPLGAPGEAARLADPGRFRWSYYDGQDLVPFPAVSVEDGAVLLDRGEGEQQDVELDGEPYGLICAEALGPVDRAVELTSLQLSSSCGETPPTFVSHNDRDLDGARFMPFGESASLFDECYIGQDQIFCQQGALVTLRFTLSFQEKLVTFTPQQEADELKIIKRKPRAVPFETARTVVDQVSLEYFNGLGWKRLPCLQDWSSLFDGEHPGPVALSFRCPDDWRPVGVGAYEERCLRLRVIRADNCYLQPCLHNMPVMEHLTVSYVFDGMWKLPHRLRAVHGVQTEDLTRSVLDGKPFAAFRPLPYAGNTCCLGFDRKLEGAPVSILFDVEENARFQSAPLTFEYSSLSGWKPLKVLDGTDNMSAVGTLVFMPPSDLSRMEVAGLSRYWLRIVDADGVFDDPALYHPQIRSIRPNAVAIRNMETMEEESFYINTATPNMTFPISAENILSTEVFVNEKGRLSQPMMRQLLRERPEDVRVEYDFLGGISSFFLRWTEVDNFDRSQPTDRHYVIDRMNNAIVFGDGVHVMIPPAQTGVAFTLRAVCCKGARANLPAGAVDSLFGNILYVDRVENPIATFAGSDIESVESAHRRGANIYSGRGRLVSQLDFVREVRAFSTSIEKVKCAAGVDLDGRPAPGAVTVAVMMRDYADGGYSWASIRDRLRERLLSRCEATLSAGALILAEPVYTEITVDVWAQADDAARAFDVQNLIRDSIDAFLDPLGRNGRGGWEIGELPTENQLRLMLRSLRLPGRITRFIATARYTDRTGVHETSLDGLERKPFVIGVGGQHHIYIELPQ